MEFLAVLTREGGNTLATFPDCPGCQTFGRGRTRALANAQEALEGWLEAHLVAGEVPPEPSSRGRSRLKGEDVALISVNPILAVRLQLRWARQRLGLTQAGLATRVGVTRQQIALLESPDANVTLRTLDRVARAMNLRLDIRLSGDIVAA
jgi:predicted RNase H-like HicB family nuclease/DNA-binding XRE family transcriptional regulator